MTTSALERLLLKHGGRKDGTRFVLENATATVFVRIGQQFMTIERVKSVEVDDEMCSVVTARGETYCVATDDVRGIRFDPPRKPGYDT